MEVRGFIGSGDRIEALPRRQPGLAVRRGGRGIAKLAKPKIRIVHVFEPEVMMTDAANFRDLVQRFTGRQQQPPPPPPPPSSYSPGAAMDGGRMMKEEETVPEMIRGVERRPPPRSPEVAEPVLTRREVEEERMMDVAYNSCGGGFLGEFEEIDFLLQLEPSDSFNCSPLLL